MILIKSIKFMLLFLVVVLVACSKHKLIKPGETPTLQPDETLALISMTRTGIKNFPAALHYRGTEGKAKGVLGSIDLLAEKDDWGADISSARIPYGQDRGRVVLFGLPAGKYEFYSLRLSDGFLEHIWFVNDFSYSFELKPDVINYIGNFHVITGHLGHNTIPLYLDLANEEARDLATFKQKHSELSHYKIAIDDGSFKDRAKVYKKRASNLNLYDQQEEALMNINKSIELNDSDAKAYRLKGDIYYKKKLYGEAEKFYKKARELESNF